MAKNYKKFSEMLTAMATILVTDWKKGEMPTIIFDVYWRMLKDRFSDQEIKQGCDQAMEGVFFPKPGELIRHIEGDLDTRARMAFRRVIQAIEDVGPYQSVLLEGPLGKTVELMGGWEFMCDRTHHELRFLERDFTDIYKNMERRFKDGTSPLKLSGVHERENVAGGFLSEIPEPTDYTDGREGRRALEKERKKEIAE